MHIRTARLGIRRPEPDAMIPSLHCIVMRFNARSCRTEKYGTMMKTRKINGTVACLVPRCRVVLLERSVMLLVHNDHPQVGEREEQRRARTDDHLELPRGISRRCFMPAVLRSQQA